MLSCLERAGAACIIVTIELPNLQVVCFAIGFFPRGSEMRENQVFAA